MIKFMPYIGDLMGLPTDENHLNFLWIEPGCKVLFSVSRIGNAASCHFASDKEGMKKIKRAIKEFIEFVFWMFDWCEFIIAKVKSDKIISLIESLKFVKISSNKNKAAYALGRP